MDFFRFKGLKLGLLCTFAALAVVAGLGGAVSRTAGVSVSEQPVAELQDDYVGSETCAACHDQQFQKVAGTKHGQLHTLASWKGKPVGCESCHGPGKAHVEAAGDVTKIISFKRLDAKTASETCLSCHAGKEAHNNFRRGDHWRNNVGCMECHAAHGPDLPKFQPGSTSLIGSATAQNPGLAGRAMLRSSEPSLCISCHSEVKAQFSKPFRHKVLEGTMNCSDCHNPHGGFEQRQTKLAVGADQSCVRCHSDKQGPFVFEHAPLKIEGCSACHTPHGSQNPKMLKRSSVRQLCIECHTDILNVALDPEATHGPHAQNVIRNQNCTVCHAAIHGSNAQRNFFR